MTIQREKIWNKYVQFAKIRIDFDASFIEFASEIMDIYRKAEDEDLKGLWRNFTYQTDDTYDGCVENIIILGDKLETDEEQAARIAKAEKYQAKKKRTAEEKKKAEQLREYKKYLKLKEKYENFTE